jgi:hypothetical protein
MGIEPKSEASEATKKELGAATARQTTFLALDPSTPSSGMLPHGDLRTKLDLYHVLPSVQSRISLGFYALF